MQVIKYLDSRFQNLLSNLSDKIGDGADGEVFLHKEGDGVSKFSIHYCWGGESLEDVIEQKLALYSSARKNPEVFVRVDQAVHLLNGVRDTFNGVQEYAIFHHEMERLEKISEDEKKMFHTILSHEDNNLQKFLYQLRF